jgi:hypothetical protein
MRFWKISSENNSGVGNRQSTNVVRQEVHLFQFVSKSLRLQQPLPEQVWQMFLAGEVLQQYPQVDGRG